jgi:hypothetical protein
MDDGHLPRESVDQPAGRPIPQAPEAMLYPLEAAHLAAVPVRTLEALRQRGGGPPVSRPGGGRWVRYQRQALLAWASGKEPASLEFVASEKQPAVVEAMHAALERARRDGTL